MSRRNLPLTSLRAFEAAARHGSFSKAADELGVTHAAVSHQMKALEELLALALFERRNTGVVLTEAGETLLPVLSESFDRMNAALAALNTNARTRTLRVTTTPVFAAHWLIPKLGRAGGSTNFDIGLVPTLEFVDLTSPGSSADIAIRCGVPPWPGLEAELLLPLHMSPVCSPSLMENSSAPRPPRQALDYPMLHADAGSHPTGEEWRLWFAAAGVAVDGPFAGPSFRDPGLSFQAAQNGLGMAIGYLELLGPDLAAGRLVQPFAEIARHPFSYYLTYPKARAGDAAISSFRTWILGEAQDAHAAP